MYAAYAVAYVWLTISIGLFKQYAPDEAAVRSAVVGATLAIGYAAVAGVIRLIRRIFRIGR